MVVIRSKTYLAVIAPLNDMNWNIFWRYPQQSGHEFNSSSICGILQYLIPVNLTPLPPSLLYMIIDA